MPNTTKWGFPKGRVGRTLRKILYPDLTEHEAEAIVVCLMIHLLLESRLNGLIFRAYLEHDAPQPPKGQQPSRSRDAFWEALVKMGFARKYDLVKPFFARLFRKEAATIEEINILRNTIFHGRAIKEAEFEGKSISDEDTVESIFLSGQFAAMQLDKFEEMMSGPYQIADEWSQATKKWFAKRCQAAQTGAKKRRPLS